MHLSILLALSSLTLFTASAFAADLVSIEDKFAESRELNALSRIPPEFRNKIKLTENTEEEIRLYCSMRNSKDEVVKCEDLSGFKKTYLIEDTSSGLMGSYEDLRDLSCLLFKFESKLDDLDFLESILELRELDPKVLSALMARVVEGSINSSLVIDKITNHPNYNSNLLYGHIIALQRQTLSNETHGNIVRSLLRSRAFTENPEYFTELLLKYSQVNSSISNDQKFTDLKAVWENGKGLSPNQVLSELSTIETNLDIAPLTVLIVKAGSSDDRFRMLRTLSEMKVASEIKSAEFEYLLPKANEEKHINALLSFVSSAAQNVISLPEEKVEFLIGKAKTLASTSTSIFSKLTGFLSEEISNKQKIELANALLEIGTNDDSTAYALSHKVREFQAYGFIRDDDEERFLNGLSRLPQTDKVRSNTLNIYLNSSPSESRANYILRTLKSNIQEEEFKSIAIRTYNETNPFSDKILHQIISSPHIDSDLSSRIVIELKGRSFKSNISSAEILIAKDMLNMSAFAEHKEDLIIIISGKGIHGEGTVKPKDEF